MGQGTAHSSDRAGSVHTMIDLRSDTVSLPSAQMLATILQAPLGDDVMGEDETVNRLERMAAELLGKEAALLALSGTMANQIAVMTLTQRGQEVVLGDRSHLFNMETGALSALSQVQARPLATPDGTFSAEQLADAIRPADPARLQSPDTGLVCLENTYDLNAGTVVAPADITAVADVAHASGVPVYLDGARLFNAAAALGVSPATLCQDVDAVQFCLTKGLGCPLGAVLAGSADFIARARKSRQRLGGGMRQGGVIAAPAIYALTHLRDRLAEDHVRASALARGLVGIDGLRVDLGQVQTNIVAATVTSAGWTADGFVATLRRHGVAVKPIAHDRVRMVAHLDIEDADVRRVVDVVGQVLREGADGRTDRPATLEGAR